MNTLSQLEQLLSSLKISSENQKIVDDLKNSFDENHVELFLEKLDTIEDIDKLFDASDESHDGSEQFIDFVSELIINKS